jgi:hypothetical protein
VLLATFSINVDSLSSFDSDAFFERLAAMLGVASTAISLTSLQTGSVVASVRVLFSTPAEAAAAAALLSNTTSAQLSTSLSVGVQAVSGVTATVEALIQSPPPTPPPSAPQALPPSVTPLVTPMPVGAISGSAGEYTYEHNMKRALHLNTPFMTRDATLEAQAQAYADTCPLGHAANRNGAGENLYMAGTTGSFVGGAAAQYTAAVQSWYDEIIYYDFATGTSMGGVIGHFTQLVWRTSTRIGCGVRLDCTNMFSGYVNSIVVCRYSAGGNYLNEYTQNVGNTLASTYLTWPSPPSAPSISPATVPLGAVSSAQSAQNSGSGSGESMSMSAFVVVVCALVVGALICVVLVLCVMRPDVCNRSKLALGLRGADDPKIGKMSLRRVSSNRSGESSNRSGEARIAKQERKAQAAAAEEDASGPSAMSASISSDLQARIAKQECKAQATSKKPVVAEAPAHDISRL